MREALELSIDREALNQVAWDGQNTVGCGPISPNSVFFDKTRKCPGRDVARAKKLLADAGLAGGYKLEMVIINDPQARRVGEVIQGMAKEVGFDISLRPSEFASALKDNDDGKHAAFVIGWSGRVDPDGNIHQGQACGGSLNATGACDEKIDALLNKAREISDVPQRRALYREAIDLLAAAAQHHLSLSPELHRGVSQESQGLQGGAGRADPGQGDRLAVAACSSFSSGGPSSRP